MGGDDGTGPTLRLDPTGDWWFTAPVVVPPDPCAEPAPRDFERPGDAAVPVDVEAAGDGAGGTPCAPGAAAAGVPEEAAARRAAAAFFADVDLAITPRFTDVLADDWVTWVAGSLPVAGQDTDIFVAVAFGPDAVVTNANAHLARPVEVHGCPTVDADTAVAPLQEQHTWQDWGKVLADPESSGQTEVRTVTLVAAGPQLLQIVDSDRTMWLLPGVRFSDADGGRWQVLTVADEYLVHATHDEPDTPEPAPEPVDTEPEVGPGKLIDETAAPTEQPRPAPAPGEPDPTDAEAIAAYLVGLSETEAVRLIEQCGYVARIVSRDGDVMMTDDYRAGRINLSIDNGMVTHADVG